MIPSGVIIMISDIMKNKRIELGLTLKQIADRMNVTEATVQRWESGNIKSLRQGRISQLAEILHTSPAVLMGWEDNRQSDQDSIIVMDDVQFYKIPQFESVAAGFGAHADEHIVGYTMLPFRSKYEAQESMSIKVCGDSMYPKIEDGDWVVVRKVSSVDSGTVAVVTIDDDDGVVKKVVYGPDWIELHSFNPMYPVRRFDGAEVTRIRVIGKVTKVIKEM